MAEPTTPADDGTVQTSIQMPPALKARLHDEAKARMLNPSVLAVKAIEDFLDRLIPVDEMTLVRPVPSTPPPPARPADDA